ncbi:fumarylacetoacetate hydrolase family protein [Nocardia beijingensis]|uniref:fumarylacetoacetate hydrolase family protein n=1 Tax=Nocardia beijingensis TaxID=95162 RepID=UPI001893FE81|nr:fumarylacetoacetate hydrolase family protein [Nocardia beijingensis]MBF6469891.1 fumarylacetoacetate hydrolase family protein [Nocardia beijingensis]
MSISVLRTSDAWWVATPAGAAKVETAATTTAQLLADRQAVGAAAASGEVVPVEGLSLVSPVTAPCRVVAQMTNFASHVKDSGGDPEKVPLTFFRKSSGSISGPHEDVIRPTHVRLLDYEVEIGLVFGREMPVGSEITPDNLPDYIAGLVVTNDISARDVQLPKTQFYEAKSYPTFTPVGPALVLLEADELKRFTDLRLRLWVNGEARQDMTVADMIYGPLETLQALTRFQRMDVGDLLLSGTPIGTALSAPPKPVQFIANLLPATVKWNLFFKGQAKNPKYLHDGDVIEATIATNDGAIDLGRQHTTVRYR